MEENKNTMPEQPAENRVNKIIPTDETTVSDTGEVSNEKTSTLTIQPSIKEDMEVHHHSHAAHGKKN